MWLFGRAKTELPTAEQALPGRDQPVPVADRHAVLGSSLAGPYPQGTAIAELALGCFWGAERTFWETEGVVSTAVGYQGGFTPNPTYEEVCSGRTGHNEVVLVVFDPAKTSYDDMLRIFWENLDPTQGMRQGNDVGTQYRSGIYTFDPAQAEAAEKSRVMFQAELQQAGYAEITTEIVGAPVVAAPTFYYAEDYHQQYLAKNPWGYCGIGGTGVACPSGLVSAEAGR